MNAGSIRGFLLCCLFACMAGCLWAQEDTYPTAERLFHIERNKNRNLVCYDVNLTDGKLNTQKPLTVYWVNREESPGMTKDLNALQRKMAYGYKLISADDDTAEVTLTAYPERTLTIRKVDGKYVCIIQIANQPAILHHLYVKAKEGNSLSVEYIELFGQVQDTGASVSERIRNK